MMTRGNRRAGMMKNTTKVAIAATTHAATTKRKRVGYDGDVGLPDLVVRVRAHLSDVPLAQGRRNHEVPAVGGAEPEALVHATVCPLLRLRSSSREERATCTAEVKRTGGVTKKMDDADEQGCGDRVPTHIGSVHFHIRPSKTLASSTPCRRCSSAGW